MDQLQKTVNELNKHLSDSGLPELIIASPSECEPQKENARYMLPEQMENLVNNIKRDGRLESVPLCYKDKNGKLKIISGHHRVEAAQKAGVKKILVMKTNVKNDGEIVAKQLSHNAINGKDDAVVLRKLYDRLDSVEMKLYSGLQDQLDSINVVSLNFRAGSFKEFTIAFTEPDIRDFDAVADQIKNMKIGSGTTVRVAPIEYYDCFAKAIMDIKKVENIKSNGVALGRLVEIANEEITRKKQQDKQSKQAARKPLSG